MGPKKLFQLSTGKIGSALLDECAHHRPPSPRFTDMRNNCRGSILDVGRSYPSAEPEEAVAYDHHACLSFDQQGSSTRNRYRTIRPCTPSLAPIYVYMCVLVQRGNTRVAKRSISYGVCSHILYTIRYTVIPQSFYVADNALPPWTKTY